ncbi:dihydrolipoamide acetyltransferase family protein [Neobacillus sp. Marseille-QA0830]
MTVEQIKMPQLGESVTEGTISKWLVAPGDRVNKYDPLAEVMTDKVNAEVPSSFAGVIKQLITDEGDTVAVGEIICTIELENSADEVSTGVQERQPEVKAPASDNPQEAKARYSPAVLKISQEHGIDLTQVSGTGAGGRITRKDLLKIIETGNIPKAGEQETAQPQPVEGQAENQMIGQFIANRPSTKETPAASAVNIPVMAGDIEIPVTGVRKAIAQNMLRSKHEAPHAWTMVEVDATNLVAFRDSLKDEFKSREGFNLTYFAFFVKAVSQALKEFPQINSMWAGDKIIQKKEINISIAVAAENALFVPVIKHADEKTIKGIGREISELAAKARTGKLRPDDMQGGTFTVNNTGSFGSVQSMGIINYPQAAILQVESIVKRPVVMNHGMIAVRDMVNLCLSLDHRILDGLICGRFLQRVKDIIEHTSKTTTSIY